MVKVKLSRKTGKNLVEELKTALPDVITDIRSGDDSFSVFEIELLRMPTASEKTTAKTILDKYGNFKVEWL